MPRYAAFLRGVSPLNAKMPELKRCFEKTGFKNVVTVLSSGNVVFDASGSSISSLEKKIEAALKKYLGREFMTVVRPVAMLQELLDSDPFKDFSLGVQEKCVTTFLREKPRRGMKFPIEDQGVRILKADGDQVFTTYRPHPKGAIFMRMLEKEFGQNITTRTWDTIKKVAAK